MEAFKYGLDIPYIQQLMLKKEVPRPRRIRTTRRRIRKHVLQKKIPIKNVVLPISTFSLNLNNRYNILGASN